MTNREFLTAVSTNAITEDVIAYATAAIAKMDEANEKRKNKTNPTPKEQEKLNEQAKFDGLVLEVMTAEPQTETEIAAALGVTGPKARAGLKRLVAANLVIKGETKVPKRGVVKTYALATVEG